MALYEVVLSISVVLRECYQGIVRLELLNLITSSWSCWLCMRPLHLSGWLTSTSSAHGHMQTTRWFWADVIIFIFWQDTDTGILLRFEGFEAINFSKIAREDVRVKKSNCTTGIRTRDPSLMISGALPTELWCSCQPRQNRTTLSLEHQTHFFLWNYTGRWDAALNCTQPSTVTHTFHIESTQLLQLKLTFS